MRSSTPLLFGIPTLDELIEIPGSDERTNDEEKPQRPTSSIPRSDATSLALLGPDGSGKSVLALHLASSYRAWCCANLKDHDHLPLILYISSDLQSESAEKVWSNFMLDQPWTRHIPFERIESEIQRRRKSLGGVNSGTARSIRLAPITPDDLSPVDFLATSEQVSTSETTVGFLDLARHTAGDDWNYVNSLIINLQAFPRPTYVDPHGRTRRLSHLVIIDSVAGFETLMGTYDAYGMVQSRRARIAQSMRNANEHAHLVFVVEEPDDGKRLPEEYVTDVVVRLRAHREGGRPRRTVEIEKARARNHATGEHEFEIRNRKGSSTGEWENPDAPATNNNYVQVFHSLSHRNLRISATYGKGWSDRQQSVKPFGLLYLDRLLENQTEQAARMWQNQQPSKQQTDSARQGDNAGHKLHPDEAKQITQWGIRAGTTAAIIGDAGTGKSVLGEKFLADGFRQLTEDFLNMYFLLTRSGNPRSEACQSTLLRVFSSISQPVLDHADPIQFPLGHGSERIEDIWRALEMAWQRGEEVSAKNLLRHCLAKGHPSTKDLPPGSVEERWKVLEDRKLDVPKLAGAAGSLGKEQPKLKSRSDYHAHLKDFRAATSIAERLKILFRHPNLRSPAVLLTTSDRLAGLLAQRCLGYLVSTIETCVKNSDESTKDALACLLEIIEEQLIVRRFDIDNITGAALFDTVQRNLVEAQYLIHGPYFPPDQSIRYRRADRIRVVIDDMRVLSNLCPSVSGDSAFLPFMVFYLEREGVTTLIVHTDNVRPGTRPTDPISQELMSLLKQLILTWSVPFEGQSRISISALPAATKETNGIVREVEVGPLQINEDHPLGKLGYTELPKVDVTRHLELYADLESGKPRLVPLAVYLFGATDACKKYIDQEDVLFRTQFLAVPGLERNGCAQRVLWPIDATEYFAIRDVTHLPWDVKADHTIVDQVDGFWSLDSEAGALASQREYLMGTERALHDDPFGLFRGRPLVNRKKIPTKKGPYQTYPRKLYFQNSNYQSRIVEFDLEDHTPEGMPDRIPFMWDFSFILAAADPWDRAGDRRIRFLHSLPPGERQPEWAAKFGTVSDVRKCLSQPWKPRQIAGWRPFLGACKAVADLARTERGINPVAFDFAASSAETLLSLFLEIWFSEIDLAVADDDTKNEADKSVGSDFCEAWKRLKERLTSKVYKPLRPEDPLAGSYALASLLRLPSLGCRAPTGNGDSSKRGPETSECFRRFREDYQKNLQAYFEKLESPIADTKPLTEPDTGKRKAKALGPKGMVLKKWAQKVAKWSDEGTVPDRNSVDIDLITQSVNQYEADPEKHRERRELFKGLPTGALCLYKAWLLLQDVFDFSAVLDPNSVFETKQPKDPSSTAMAVRHYYRTACHEQMRGMEKGPDEPPYILAMPGNFSTRGDSFLASAKASRSQLMASNAIDLLCSRRANLTRMQMGIGLPVRDVMEEEQCKEMRTALRAKNSGGALDDVRYEKLCSLGEKPPNEESGTGEPAKLQWFFRNGIPDYDRISRTMQKWLARLFRWTISYRARHVLGWDGGFHGYDALSVHTFGPFLTYTSFDEFSKLCDYLIAELEAAERRIEKDDANEN
jgi:KaiC/GvpD/RAD55 family RecA-like ATPase